MRGLSGRVVTKRTSTQVSPCRFSYWAYTEWSTKSLKIENSRHQLAEYKVEKGNLSLKILKNCLKARVKSNRFKLLRKQLSRDTHSSSGVQKKW